MSQSAIYNNTLANLTASVPKNILNAIQKASASTGVDFAYLIEKASAESSFDANAKAKTSSATGLFQFIESTWLNMVKEHGDKYGLGAYADKIGDNGKVSDSKTRRDILALRKDPQIASYMAAEYANENKDYLQEKVGGKIGSTEMYLAHFMGANGASAFLNAMKQSPNMAAADLFPKEARANRAVFYDSTSGQPRSLQQIYAMFDTKFEGAPSQNFAAAGSNDNDLRTVRQSSSNPYFAYASGKATAEEATDPFARISALLGTDSPSSSLRTVNTSQTSWQIFPPSLYNRLSLSPAQLMMLSDFDA